MITLYQFQCSHYCEKVRWALDYKGLPHRQKNLVPGPHLKLAQKFAAKTSLPIIVDDGTAVQDSTEIISFLDRKFPDPPLTPRDLRQAGEALEWEEYLDEEIGMQLRRWFYHHMLPDRDRAQRFLLQGAPWYGRPLFAVIFPQIRDAMRKYMHIDAESAVRSEQRFSRALVKLGDALKGRQFLVGDSFSRADLTACALLSPYCAPGKSDQELSFAFPPPVLAQRDAHKSSPVFAWVRDTYGTHRARPAGRF